jgi:hypothetical protein
MMQGPINVKSPNNTSKWQMGFNSAFKGLMLKDYPPHVIQSVKAEVRIPMKVNPNSAEISQILNTREMITPMRHSCTFHTFVFSNCTYV